MTCKRHFTPLACRRSTAESAEDCGAVAKRIGLHTDLVDHPGPSLRRQFGTIDGRQRPELHLFQLSHPLFSIPQHRFTRFVFVDFDVAFGMTRSVTIQAIRSQQRN